MKILVVDDNKQINDYWSLELFRMNFLVESSFSLEQTYSLLEQNSFDLVLLDLNLGTNISDGFQIIDYINRKKTSTSIIVISGNNIEDFNEKQLSIIRSIFAFVKKPCLKNELTIVIEKWLMNVKQSNVITYGKFELDLNKKIIYKNKRILNLSDIEYNILSHMINAQGETLSKEYFVREVSHTLDQHLGVYIFRLREKLGPNSIISIRNKGFSLNHD